MPNYPAPHGKKMVNQKAKPVAPKIHTGPGPELGAPHTANTSKAEIAQPKGKDSLAKMNRYAAAQPPRQMDTKSIISKLDTITVPNCALPPVRSGDSAIDSACTAIITHGMRYVPGLEFEKVLDYAAHITFLYPTLSDASVSTDHRSGALSKLKTTYYLLR